MPTLTPNLQLPIPLGNETNNRTATVNLINKIDEMAAKKADLTTHLEDLAHVHWLGNTTGTNTLTATYADITAYTDGLGVSFKNTTDSNAVTSLNINGLGAVPILKANGGAVNNLKANGVYTLRYVSGNFILQGEGASGNATVSDLLSGKTASTDAGDIVGTMPDRGTFNLSLGDSVPAGYYSGGTVPSGKRWASGTSPNSSYADITSLSFQPSIVIVDFTAYAAIWRKVYYQANELNNYSYRAIGTEGPHGFSVKLNGFYVNFPTSSTNITWIAIE